jgi:hypothetical protein
LLSLVTDKIAREGIADLIEEMTTEKAALHPNRGEVSSQSIAPIRGRSSPTVPSTFSFSQRDRRCEQSNSLLNSCKSLPFTKGRFASGKRVDQACRKTGAHVRPATDMKWELRHAASAERYLRRHP